MANSQAREEFSKRLRKALQDRGRGIGSPTRLTQEFNSDYPDRRVTPQAVRKWLNGEAIPSHDKVKALAEWLEVSPNWLHHGEGGAGHAEQTAAIYRNPLPDQELLKRYRKLHPRQQQAVVHPLDHRVFRAPLVKTVDHVAQVLTLVIVCHEISSAVEDQHRRIDFLPQRRESRLAFGS